MKSHMINTKTISKPAEHEPECRCGCAPCEENPCELTCLVQPRYYCGQMLTDADLTAMLRWAQDKFRLERFRGGWGVACGLDVRYDPDNPGHVIISPGYALDCCGNDIVVCAPTSIDLTAECKAEECLDPWQQEDPKRAQAEKEKDAGASDFDLGVLFGRAEVFDLFLHYKEQPSDAQKALGRSVCSTRGECEWSRTREDFRVSVRPARADRDPREEAWERWQKPYQDGRKKFVYLLEQIARAEQNNQPDQARRLLMEWVRQHPLEQFGFVKEWIFAVEAGDFAQQMARIVFWLWLDYQGSLLHCVCPTCESADGVPLARVWLSGALSEQQPGCFVAGLDNTPPHRRLLQADPCWPAPTGCINLGQFFMQPAGAVLEQLAQEGYDLPVQEIDFTRSVDRSMIGSMAQCDRITACPEDVVDDEEGDEDKKKRAGEGSLTIVIGDLGGPWGRRVVSFCRLVRYS